MTPRPRPKPPATPLPVAGATQEKVANMSMEALVSQHNTLLELVSENMQLRRYAAALERELAAAKQPTEE